MFRAKHRPGAMEFAACTACNEGTRGATRAMMPGDEIDGRGLDCAAAFAAQATEQISKVISPLRAISSHGIADRAASGNGGNPRHRRTPYVDRRRGLHKTHIRCMARLPNAGEAKFLASSR